MNLQASGKRPDISLVDGIMTPVRHNSMRRSDKMSEDIAADGRGATGWHHGFKPRLPCNDRGEVMAFRLTGVSMDDRFPLTCRRYKTT